MCNVYFWIGSLAKSKYMMPLNSRVRQKLKSEQEDDILLWNCNFLIYICNFFGTIEGQWSRVFFCFTLSFTNKSTVKYRDDLKQIKYEQI
jgi:hypothetical protein